ncbi:hypothetical protein HMPREF9477_01710 [Lachnospiraceae bacterium 2_1_46FAA]|jgi:energy-coupling factor transport system permease protein|nr:hypothetical protein HMPREF9477_01710 [Lachnospiraceae bacterium 2_1_46FAA]
MNKKQKGIKLLNPLTVLYLVILLAVVSALFDYKITIVSVLVMMLLAGISGEGKPYFLLWLKSIFLICVICFVLQSLFIPGEQIIWKVWVFSIKVESVQKAIILCSRILGIGSAILLGGKLIDIKKLMIVLEKKGMSSSVTYVLLSTTNIIPQMSKKMGAILEAQKSRGIETDSNMIVRAKAFFPSVGPLLLNSLVNAEERAITLEARAFSAPCKKTSLKNVEDSSRDKMLRIVFIAATILAIGGKIVLWIV